MVWNAQNSPFAGGTNYAAYGSPNYAAYGAPNYAAYSAPNYSPSYAAYSAPNYAPNYAAYSAPNYAPNYAAYGGANYAAYPVAAAAVSAPASPVPMLAGGTGAGGASGSGFIGGYGPVPRFEYATPAALAPLPWVLDFASGDGWPSFPLDLRIKPSDFDPPLQWQHCDWDPALRFWTRAFDPHLTEWLQDLNLASPAVTAAREFADASKQWLASGAPSDLHQEFKRDAPFLAWNAVNSDDAWVAIDTELEELIDLMRDDRMRYLQELGVQSSQAVPYFVQLMRFDPATKPWTMELMNCASSIGNLVKMQYKSHYKRVRPSTLCPGLVPPWGPAQHPSFPSGHSTVAHLTALFLLSVPKIAERFGIFEQGNYIGRAPSIEDFEPSMLYGQDQRSPLLWLAWRIAKGRERLGVHYKSDSAAGRRLAALVWDACLNPEHTGHTIPIPALSAVLSRAQAEWA
jgi:hypothetical protein